jgi:hypothetical protein
MSVSTKKLFSVWFCSLIFCWCAVSLHAQARVGSTVLPASSLLDLSSTLAKPAGGRGFLTTGTDGKFHWADGSRARFWGINVASTRLNIPREQIEEVVKNFARAGLNLVRLEAIDNRNCLLGSPDAPTSRQLDRAYLDKLDYWMHCLRQNGIYYYLDLLDFRTFRPGDGVLNAERLDRAARPYAVFDRRLIELQKEYAGQLLLHKNPYSGLRPIEDPAFALLEICNEHGFFLYPDKLDTMVEPYRTNLQAMWNQWLLEVYGTREKLKAWWGDWSGSMVLKPDEDPLLGTVKLPPLSSPKQPNEKLEVMRAPSRQRDGVRFLFLVQQNYFKEMYKYLRDIGVRIPITGVVSNDILPDLLSVASSCDFVAGNWYGEVERFDSRTPGLRYYGNRNPLSVDGTFSLAPFTASLRWQKKPVVIREFATSPPNRWRGTTVPEMLSYASLQDYDAVLLFAYQTNRAPNGMEADALNDYAFQCDPVVWGVYAMAGQAFLQRAIRPAKVTVTMTLPDDVLFNGAARIGNLYQASWSHGVKSVFSPALNVLNYLSPIDRSRESQQLKAFLQTKKEKGNLPVRPEAVSDGIWVSDTGEIRRISSMGRLEVRTPRLRMLTGDLTPNRVYDLGNGIRFGTQTQIASLLIYTLDGKPIAQSKHLWIKMVSRAENTGQVLTPASQNAISEYVLKTPGKGPVVTFGRPAKYATHLWLNPNHKGANTLFSLWMEDGTWEIVIRNGRVRLQCDTPGITGKVLGKVFQTTEQGLTEIPNPAPPTAN